MIEIGDIVRTSYGTGPYRVVEVYCPDGGCVCPAPLDEINMRKPPASEPHFHVTLVKASFPIDRNPRESECYWLNGYTERGGRYISVWSKDEIFVDGKTPGVQLRLFDF